MAIVMPRSRSSGALSIESNARYLAPPCVASTLVIAAVSVVLPWSMCPIVPTFTCGLLRTNFCFAIASCPLCSASREMSHCPRALRLSADMLPALLPLCPHHLARRLRLNLLGDAAWHLGVMRELHRIGGAPAGCRAQIVDV